MTEQKIGALVEAALNEFKNNFLVAAILQPQRELAVWKVVLIRHQHDSQEPLTIAVDLHSGDTDEQVKASIRKQILESTR